MKNLAMRLIGQTLAWAVIAAFTALVLAGAILAVRLLVGVL